MYVLSYYHAGDHLLPREFHTHYCNYCKLTNFTDQLLLCTAAVRGVANAVSQVATEKGRSNMFLCARM